MKPNLIVVLGPTASGKTKLAAQLAYELDTEIISADSRQVYKELNIGAGKDYNDYLINQKKIPTHLIDIVSISEQYHIHQFKKDFESVFDKIDSKISILCGGTGLYIDAILRDLDFTQIPVNQELRNELLAKTHAELMQIFKNIPQTRYTNLTDTSTHKRLIRGIEICTFLQHNSIQKATKKPIYPFVIGIGPDVEIRRKNIENRLKNRIENGLIEEVENLLKSGFSAERLIYLGLEYKFVTEHLMGKTSLTQLTDLLTIAIQQFAKRQMTYFRKMERSGLKINWLNEINLQTISTLKSKIELATL